MRKSRMMLIRATHSQVNLQSARNLQPTCPQSCWPRGEDSGQSQPPTSLHGLARPHRRANVSPRCPRAHHPSPAAPRTHRGCVQTPRLVPRPSRRGAGPVPSLSGSTLGAVRASSPSKTGLQNSVCGTASTGGTLGTLGTTSSTHTPSPTLLPSRASGQSVISVKSFMAAGGSWRSLAKILPSALCPPALPPSPPQLPPWVLGQRGDRCSPLWGEDGGNASSTRGGPAAEPTRGPCPPCRECGEPREAAVP